MNTEWTKITNLEPPYGVKVLFARYKNYDPKETTLYVVSGKRTHTDANGEHYDVDCSHEIFGEIVYWTYYPDAPIDKQDYIKPKEYL